MAMAFTLQNPFSIVIFVCFVFASPWIFVNGDDFSSGLGIGTWYGAPNGAGSGGACGWANDLRSPPFSSMIAAGNSRIFKDGKGCGDCYQIKCNRQPYCSLYPITVTITGECPGHCNNVPFHFDLSGHAFSAMATPGQAYNLLNLGQVDIQYKRVPCYYGRTKIAFKVDENTNTYWFATAVEFTDRYGELQSMEIAPAGTHNFVPMNNILGVVWQANVDESFHGPFSFRLTSYTNEVVIARNSIPFYFYPGQTYYSHVNSVDSKVYLWTS